MFLLESLKRFIKILKLSFEVTQHDITTEFDLLNKISSNRFQKLCITFDEEPVIIFEEEFNNCRLMPGHKLLKGRYSICTRHQILGFACSQKAFAYAHTSTHILHLMSNTLPQHCSIMQSKI